jgi:hypothetical protein
MRRRGPRRPRLFRLTGERARRKRTARRLLREDSTGAVPPPPIFAGDEKAVGRTSGRCIAEIKMVVMQATIHVLLCGYWYIRAPREKKARRGLQERHDLHHACARARALVAAAGVPALGAMYCEERICVVGRVQQVGDRRCSEVADLAIRVRQPLTACTNRKKMTYAAVAAVVERAAGRGQDVVDLVDRVPVPARAV